MTTIINLYGGPGAGKSTSAAYLFYLAKQAGMNAELVREYAKDWAWDKRTISVYDQFYLMGKQIRRESMLYGKVDFIVTDSPVYLASYYAKKYAEETIAEGVDRAIAAFYRQASNDGHKHVHVMLKRAKGYNPAGRYQTEEQARLIDDELQETLQSSPYRTMWCGTSGYDLEEFFESSGVI